MIQIKNLVKKYGEVSAVNDISLEVQAGEIFAFLGPNGAGKTTTIKMLTTLLHADERVASGSTVWIRITQSTRGPTPVRHRLSGSEPRSGADGVREHGPARRALSACRARRATSAPEQLLKLFELWDRQDDRGEERSQAA